MGIKLPDSLSGVAKKVHLEWPHADEDKLWQVGNSWWSHLSNQMDSLYNSPDEAVNKIPAGHEGNEGESIDAFLAYWGDHAHFHAGLASSACKRTGVALTSAAMALKTYKQSAVKQLTALKKFCDKCDYVAGTLHGDSQGLAMLGSIKTQAINQVKQQVDSEASTAKRTIAKSHPMLDGAGKDFDRICREAEKAQPNIPR
jgi:hypothetical protein